MPYFLKRYRRWGIVLPLLIKHEEVMSHTELLLKVNIHWLLVIHSYDVCTIETFTHKIRSHFLSLETIILLIFFKTTINSSKTVALGLDFSFMRPSPSTQLFSSFF